MGAGNLQSANGAPSVRLKSDFCRTSESRMRVLSNLAGRSRTLVRLASYRLNEDELIGTAAVSARVVPTPQAPMNIPPPGAQNLGHTEPAGVWGDQE
jgi:hypothetical protein